MSWSLILMLALVGQTAAAGDAAKELPAKVTKLIKQLDDEELARREAAEKSLVELGHTALELLPSNTTRMSAETKERLGRVRRQLEIKLAETSAQPTRVTLSGEMKLSEVIAAISKQTNNPIVDYRSEFNQQTPDPKIKVSFKDTPFWEALDDVFDTAGMALYPYGGKENSLAMVARAAESELPRSGRAAYAGRFRFDGVNVTATRDLRNPANHNLQLTLEVAWEPSLKPIVLVQPLDQIVATSDEGKPLVIDGSDGAREIQVKDSSLAEQFDINLQLPSRDVRKIAKLQGKFTAIVPGKVETFEFTEISKLKNSVQRRAAGVSVVFEEVRKNEDVYEVRMRVEFDKAANALESHRSWFFENFAGLVAPDGSEISHDGLEETRREANVAGVAYKFVLEEDPVGYKFIYKTPVMIMKLPVEYELKNIDLP